MKKVFISGAGGFIGRKLVNRFFDEGYDVYALVRNKNKYLELEDKSTIISFGELDEWKKSADNFNGSIYYHLAWQGVNGADKRNMDIQLNNILAAKKAAEMAKELGCSRFLCAGSIAERSLESIASLETVPDGMMYAAAKQALRCVLDVYCKNIGLDYVWMQFSNVYGPADKTGNIVSYTLEQILNGKEALFGPAMQPYDLLYINDLAEAVFRLGTADIRKQFYFVGSGTPRKLKSYLESIGKATGKSKLIKIGEMPDDGIKYSMDMFSTDELEADIGNYVSGDFETLLKNTIEHYFAGGGIEI